MRMAANPTSISGSLRRDREPVRVSPLGLGTPHAVRYRAGEGTQQRQKRESTKGPIEAYRSEGIWHSAPTTLIPGERNGESKDDRAERRKWKRQQNRREGSADDGPVYSG